MARFRLAAGSQACARARRRRLLWRRLPLLTVRRSVRASDCATHASAAVATAAAIAVATATAASPHGRRKFQILAARRLGATPSQRARWR